VVSFRKDPPIPIVYEAGWAPESALADGLRSAWLVYPI
jgi:hypothetical protein